MVKRLYLHVGPHKTGTTYIQQQFAMNSPILDTLGVVYPHAAINISLAHKCGHHDLFAGITGRCPPDRVLPRSVVLAMLEHCQIAVLSSETVSDFVEADLDRIKEYFSDFEIYPVIFLRRRSDLLHSKWIEEVKWGSTEDFRSYVSTHLVRPFTSSIINPLVLIRRMEGIFGREKMLVMSYDNILANGMDIADALLETIVGHPLPGKIGGDEKVNVSMRPGNVETIRLFNAHYQACGYVPGHHVRANLIQRWQRRDSPFTEICDWVGRFLETSESPFDLENINHLFAHIDRQIQEQYRAQLTLFGSASDVFPEKKGKSFGGVALAEMLLAIQGHFDVRNACLKLMNKSGTT